MSWDFTYLDYIEQPSYSSPGLIDSFMPWGVGGWYKFVSGSASSRIGLFVANGVSQIATYMGLDPSGNKIAYAEITSSNRAYTYSTAGAWDNNWHHLLGTYSARTAAYVLWLDGVPVFVTQFLGGYPNNFTPNDLYWEVVDAAGHWRVAEDCVIAGHTITQDDVDLLAGTNYGGNNAANVGKPYSPKFAASTRGWSANLLNYHDLLANSTLGTGGFSDGRNDQVGTAAYSTVFGNAAVNADHPANMVYTLTGSFAGQISATLAPSIASLLGGFVTYQLKIAETIPTLANKTVDIRLWRSATPHALRGAECDHYWSYAVPSNGQISIAMPGAAAAGSQANDVGWIELTDSDGTAGDVAGVVASGPVVIKAGP